ncbi:TIGR04338 family metallohydrolase [Rhodococcoides yunnanense]|uniref:TIGR04338 family metallohydrolase n=1 Tax=Rhodococcoides yunnanense TaxID=278209 RepID=A0ABU4B8Q8_9NOCA|nr:TIGR04338 family metallohydrolase [Rhodococcus yunnanensis]MDV6260579.1 TIGR04338 family metallohydrolase [Rhodococcus yunnanensis]
MSRARDAQRSAVYDAEQLVRTMFDRAEEREIRVVQVMGSQITLPVERKFASLKSVQTYIDAVLALDWVASTWPGASRVITVRARSGSGAAHYEPDTATIAVPLHHGNRAWALRELVVLHELAHHFADENEQQHGGAFVDRYITLVGEIIGSEAGFVLRAMMAESGVRIG